MTTPKDIEEFKTQMKDRHNARLGQQRIDRGFFENKYPLTLIKKPEYQMRTNFAARMINSVTQQLITDLPKIYVKPKGDTDTAKEAGKRISIVLNRWVAHLIKLAVNPFEETFKNYNVSGESWLYIPHNMMLAQYRGNWEEDYPDIPPVHFILYDPMVVFTEPAEEVNGEPNRVLVSYERTVSDIKKAYPHWTNPKHIDDNKKITFLLYFDGERSYAEADEEPLFRNRMGKFLDGTGERINPYKCLPFVHLYSGWGKSSSDMSPDLLAYSRIRMLRDLITEDSQVRSDQLYNFHAFAHRSKTLYVPAGAEVGADWAAAFLNEPDKLNLVHLPEGANPDWFKPEESLLFEAPAFAYADRIRADLAQEFPAPLQGGIGTSSGREADILRGAGLSIYDCAVDNTAGIWARGFMKALKVCASIDMLPKNLNKGDLDRCEEIIVDLRTDNPIERDRLITMGSTLVNDGKRSLKTFLMKDMRMTEEESEDEIDNILVDKIMLQSPEIAAFLGFKAAQKSGMADELQAYRNMMAQTGKEPSMEMGSPIGTKGGEPRRMNIKTQQGREEVDISNVSYGQRTPAAR